MVDPCLCMVGKVQPLYKQTFAYTYTVTFSSSSSFSFLFFFFSFLPSFFFFFCYNAVYTDWLYTKFGYRFTYGLLSVAGLDIEIKSATAKIDLKVY